MAFKLSYMSVNKNLYLAMGLLTMLSIFVSTEVKSEEIAPFRVTNLTGELKLKLISEDHTSSLGSGDSYSKGTTFEQVFDIMVHSYIYHPRMIRLNFGGGPILNQNSYDSNLYNFSSQEQTFNFYAVANILEKKPYPLTLFFDHTYGNSGPSTQDRMLLEKTKYGFNFSLRRPIFPVAVNFKVSHSQANGRNSQRVVDNNTDLASVTMSGDLGSNGTGFAGLYRVQSQSQDGVRSLPISTSSKVTDTFNLRTEHWYFEEQKMHLTNFFTYKKQDNQPSITELWYRPDLSWMHSDNLRSFYRYSFRDATVQNTKSTTHSLNMGFNYSLLEKRLGIDVDTHIGSSDTVGLQQNTYGADLDLRFLQNFDSFNIQYRAGWGLDYTDRNVTSNQIPVFSESHILNNTTHVDLSRKNVVAGSVVVNNQANTQVYVENIDYILTLSGDTTRIQRIPTGMINDGDTVFFDYYYDSGGTASFSGLSQYYGIDISKGKYYNVYGFYQHVDRSVRSGNPTTSLAAQQDLKFGFTLDIPLANNWMVGGRGEVAFVDGVSTYEKQIAGAYVQLPLSHNSSLRVYSDWQYVNQENAGAYDTDLVRYGLRYKSQPWSRAIFTADIRDEQETGGSTDRTYTSAIARLDWTIRQLRLSGVASYNNHVLGSSEREKTKFNLLLTRRF